MIERLRIVCDTNVILSAALFEDSVTRRVLNTIKTDAVIILSKPVLREIQDVLSRKKFDKYISLEDRFKFLQSLVVDTESVEITSHITECSDPKDNKFLELAVDGKADYIVTGDEDLLRMNPFQNIRILSPTDFLMEIEHK
jgi:putative PIN family toxin of toxin-antitoxin system